MSYPIGCEQLRSIHECALSPSLSGTLAFEGRLCLAALERVDTLHYAVEQMLVGVELDPDQCVDLRPL